MHPETHSTVVSGRRLRVSRLVWATGVGLYSALFALGLPGAFERARVLAPATRSALEGWGIRPGWPAAYWLTLDTLTFLAFAAVALLIVWHRPDDWLVMLTSLMLVGTAALYTAAPAEAPLPVPVTAFAFALAEIFQVAFLFLFPNGKFVPRWLWIFLVPMFLWRPAIWTMTYLPDFDASVRTGDNYGTLRQDALDTVLILILYVIGIVGQVYRYRHVSTSVQRQQTKWLLFGMICAFVTAAAYVLLVNVFGVLEGAGQALLARMFGRTVRQLALFMLPLTLAFSILRYRLWGIDLLLRRTLVYVPLTAILTGLFAALIPLSQQVAVDLTGEESLVVTVLATLVIVAASEPLKGAIQRLVDRTFKEAPEAQSLLRAFSERVERRMSQAEPHQLVQRFLDQAVRAFEAQGGAAYLARGGELELVYKKGEPASVVTIPLMVGPARVGVISLGERPFERGYTRADRIMLGRAATIVAQAIREDSVKA